MSLRNRYRTVRFGCYIHLSFRGRPPLVDAGVAATTETITDGIEACGVSPSDLSNLGLSHIHVDYTGAASARSLAAPDLDIYIHESTAPHLTNPDGLLESSKQAMGDHFERMGEQGAVPRKTLSVL